MKSSARRSEIINLARESGLTSVDDLATHFGVSPSTIRRDLAILTQSGQIARTYGGAIALAPHPEASLRQRLGEAYRAKHAIGKRAASLVREGESILLDAGTTTGAMAESLVHQTGITVTTSGITALLALSNATDLDVFVLGGRLRALSQGLVGPMAEAALERLTFDRAFMGADAINVDFGICEAALDQTRLKELMMKRSRSVYVLADSSKLNKAPFHAWALMPRVWTLITDADASPQDIERFVDRGVHVEIASDADTALTNG